MKKLYVTTKDVFYGQHFIGGRMQPRFNLFHKGTGSSWMELDENHILLAADFDSEHSENEWHAHSKVARLPHPVHEKDVPISHLHIKPEHAHKQFTASHFSALQKALGVDTAHTVWDLNKKLKERGWHGLVLSPLY